MMTTIMTMMMRNVDYVDMEMDLNMNTDKETNYEDADTNRETRIVRAQSEHDYGHDLSMFMDAACGSMHLSEYMCHGE